MLLKNIPWIHSTEKKNIRKFLNNKQTNELDDDDTEKDYRIYVLTMNEIKKLRNISKFIDVTCSS